MPMIWDEIRSLNVRMRYPTTWNTIHLIKTHPDLSFFDVVDTQEKEDIKILLRRSFALGVDDVASWKTSSKYDTVRWADFKDTYIEHLAFIPQFSYHVQHGGNHDIVNASTRRHGPSWRMIVSLEQGNIQPFGVYPGGQSGNPGSIYYNNMLDHWSNGQYFNLIFMKRLNDQKEKIMFTTQMKPKE
jgi:penicillin amidase